MNAIRQILKVENHRVTVELPADFAAEEVEVIVLPAEVPEVIADESGTQKPRPENLNPRNSRNEDEQSLTELQQLLLNDKTVMSDEEYDFIEEKRRALNAWK